MKVLHITESLGAGVEHYLAMVTREQARAGHCVVLAHSMRADTPTDKLDAEFGFLERRVMVPMVTDVSLLKDFSSVLHLIRLIRQERPDVIHLHSSKAGVLGRLAALLAWTRARVFYSPHGFAFLRLSVVASVCVCVCVARECVCVCVCARSIVTGKQIGRAHV